MRKDQNHQFKYSLYLALAIVFCTYLALTASVVLFFGAYDVKPSIFDNFSEQDDIWSKAILIIFLLVLFCNIPFAFFAGKTAVIAMLTIINSFQRDGDEFTSANSEGSSDIGTITSPLMRT